MCKADLPAVAQLEKECFAEAWSENALAESLAESNYVFFVAAVSKPSCMEDEKDTEEISEEDALPEASGTENYVEENDGISEEETVAAKNPAASEEDEWLYSQPRRFAKKPAHEQKD